MTNQQMLELEKNNKLISLIKHSRLLCESSPSQYIL